MKLKSIQFEEHPILGDLLVDFCDSNGNPVDTIIIAGENGTGKSTLLNEIYKVVNYQVNSPMNLEYSDGIHDYKIKYYPKDINGKDYYHASGKIGEHHQISSNYMHETGFTGIYSDVDINFHSTSISSVTSMNIDTKGVSRKSDGNITQEIQQLIIDIQNLDDSELSKKIRDAYGKEISINDSITDGRMKRFRQAFDYMFCDLTYDGVENVSERKKIIFKRGDIKIHLDDLSSGEKQVIYRGSFLLRDINALSGAVVLIDEPEISMHPEWQKKIMDFYKRIFTSSDGVQTSQIFAVTHSPFIIHNNQRKNDKVIVLSRNENGRINILDKPEYYLCDSKQAVQDAFRQNWITPNGDTVYLEGRTDEKYFNKTVEVFGYKKLPFKFKWIGHLNANGQEEFTGEPSLSKAYQFSLSAGYKFKQVFLFDCDTNRREENIGLSYVKAMPRFDNNVFKKGIENALVIDGLSSGIISRFYSQKTKIDDYGAENKISEFNKMEFCEYICSQKKDIPKGFLINLKNIIDELLTIYK